jgi:2'-5' RNA ligase
MSPLSDFKFVSTATAIAIIAAPQHHAEVNKLRSVHDKAYHKWQPHINILYPFVQAPQLDDAVDLLRSALQASNIANFGIKINDVGVFRHRKNATIFLSPDSKSTQQIGMLRKFLVETLGRKESDGTYDGMFRPHLTIGQAGLQCDSVQRLSDKIRRLVGIEWECSSLAVLRRKLTGEMELVDELSLGIGSSEQDVSPLDTTSSGTRWTPCFSLNNNGDWEACNEAVSTFSANTTLPKEIMIASYNLMAESVAPSFTNRASTIFDAIISATSSNHGLRVLNLQEVNDEILPLLLSNSQIRKIYPYSTHKPSSVFESKRNLVTLASESFASFTVDFVERHKSSLVIKFCNSGTMVANVHLTSTLTDSAVVAKTRQMATLTKFLTNGTDMTGPVFVAGDFNLTSSPKTIEAALGKRMITRSTATAVNNVIGQNVWADAFLKCIETNPGEGDEDTDSYEEIIKERGVTFDRLSNPLAALSKGPVDDRPQRYDRILWAKNELLWVEVECFERFGFPDKMGECGSDHYGVCATMSLSRTELSQNLLADELKPGPQPGDITLVPDERDLEALLISYMPNEKDRTQRASAMHVLKEALGGDIILAPLGSYAMDTYFPNSDMDLLVIGAVAPPTFFKTAQDQLRVFDQKSGGAEPYGDGIKGLHFVNSLVPIIEVVVRGIKIDLQYCQAAELVTRSAYPQFSYS